MNPASSRSHCIFTIALEGKDLHNEVIRISKLHLVDLAGSERVYKKIGNGAQNYNGISNLDQTDT